MFDAQIRCDNPLLRNRALYPVWESERVRWSDTDMIGHVNNLAFAAYLETGRSLLLRRFSTPDANPRALFLLGEMTTRFIAEAHWPAMIDIGTAIVEIGARTVQVCQGLFEGERCVTTSVSSLVLIDEQTRRARAIPPEVRDWLAQFIMRPC